MKNITNDIFQEISKVKDVISLAGGTPPFAVPKEIWQKFYQKTKNNPLIACYPKDTQGNFILREQIAQELQKEFKYKVSPDEILLTAGSSAGIFISLLYLLKPGDKTMLFEPFWTTYLQKIKLVRGQPCLALLDEKNNYQINFNFLKKSLKTRLKVILLCDPNNPTGTCFDLSQKQTLLKLALKHNLKIIIDETYRQLVYPEANFFSFFSQKESKNTGILVRSFSKDLSASGLRLGYIFADKKIITRLNNIHTAINLFPSSISQEIISLMYPKFKQIAGCCKKQYARQRKVLCNRLDKLKNFFDYVKPTGGFFVFPKYHIKMDSIAFFRELLFKAKVAVRPGIAFGRSGEGHVRMSFILPPEKINQAFDRIEKYVSFKAQR